MRRKNSSTSPPTQANELRLETSLLRPGLRLAVGLSGGADSVALMRALKQRSSELGLVLHAAHLHHGLRGPEADADLNFARALALELGLPFHEARVDTNDEAQANAETGKPGETIEEAARRLRYGWFRQLMARGEVDAVATAHTLDDQAETVLAKFLRGAWTEGLSGIHPVVNFAEGQILRPLLGTKRAEIEAYLRELGQSWREDSSNRHLTFTRNRIRHELLPLLETWNPRLPEHLAQMAALALDEEAWWEGEMARLAPQFLLTGRPVRGGGRAGGDGVALDVTRLAALAPAVQRRLLRYAAQKLGAAPDFASTEALRALALTGRAGQMCELAQGLRAERTPRELRLTGAGDGESVAEAAAEYGGTIPGEILAPAFGLKLRIDVAGESEPPSGAKAHAELAGDMYGLKPVPFSESLSVPFSQSSLSDMDGLKPVPFSETSLSDVEGIKAVPISEASLSEASGKRATLRNWKPGDRVKLRYSGKPRKVKEVLERMKVTGSSRVLWPVLEVDGRIVWMKGVELEPEPSIAVKTISLAEG